MIGAPNSLNLNCKVRVMKEVPGPLVSEEIADIFTNYNIDEQGYDESFHFCTLAMRNISVIFPNKHVPPYQIDF